MQDSLFSAQPGESNETLEEINDELLRRAKSLPQFRERVFIFGEGPAGAKAAVVGESPGPPDIESGRPFMGPAGQMLERILSSIGLARGDCYLTNVVKAISQGDEITPEWLSLFTPYLHRELAAARPRVVIAFGNTPTRALLPTKKPISPRLRRSLEPPLRRGRAALAARADLHLQPASGAARRDARRRAPARPLRPP